MTSGDAHEPTVSGGARSRLLSLSRVDTFRAVVAVTVLSVVARLVGLGWRAAHWDEGRVAYWILQYAETGAWEYRPIVHGPFLFHVDKYVFTVLGASDFTARLPVAIVGGLLPAAAWLLRDRLRDSEVVALSVVLAGNPLLLYYSRFMRNDVLVAGFMMFAFAFFVRAIDTGGTRYLYAGTAAAALGFTAKENALLYVVSWLGALVVVADARGSLRGRRSDAVGDGAGGGVDTPPETGDSGGPTLLSHAETVVRTALRTASRYRVALAIAALEFLAIIVFFYAPRAGAGDQLGLWRAFTHPTTFPAVIEEALLGSWEKLKAVWIDAENCLYCAEYGTRLENMYRTLRATAGVVVVFAALGFVVDRYSAEGPRDLVTLATAWGVAAIPGYAYATDIWAPWVAVHAVAPLAIPAAVGLALLYRWGREALADEDLLTAGLTAALLVLVATPAAITVVDVGYLNSDGHDRILGGDDDINQHVMQWAQPGNDLKESLRTVEAVARTNEGTDVLLLGSSHPTTDGSRFYVPDDEVCTRRPPVHEPRDQCSDPDLSWHSRLPLPWYLEAYGADVVSSRPGQQEAALQDPPPVVIAYGWERAGQNYEWDRGDIRRELPARYEDRTHRFKLWETWDEQLVVFVDRTAIPDDE